MKKLLTTLLLFVFSLKRAQAHSNEPLVTAQKFLDHKKSTGHFSQTDVPVTILVCYQQSTLDYLLGKHPEATSSKAVSNLYLLNTRVAILGGFGVGAPNLAIKMELLIAHGAKRFVAVGTAGALMNAHPIGAFIIAPKALAEDGVAHHYLSESFAQADPALFQDWSAYAKEKNLPQFQPGSAWSFSAIFKESPAHIHRVKEKGCSLVEMEAATLYAIGQEKKVQTLSLFVISDNLTQDAWDCHIKEKKVRDNLHTLADWALNFCQP